MAGLFGKRDPSALLNFRTGGSIAFGGPGRRYDAMPTLFIHFLVARWRAANDHSRNLLDGGVKSACGVMRPP